MKLFRRNNKVLDLSERYRKQQARAAPQAYPETFPTEMSTGGKEMKSENNAGGFGFFGAIANTAKQSSSSEDSDYVEVSVVDERRKKLAKRLMDMTEKIEELSNQIYHLQQRIEVLERKNNISGF